MNQVAHKHSDVHIARIDRRHVNARKWHQVKVREFHKAVRQATRLNLRNYR